jgi:Flp pilus assembly protein TadG
MPKSFNFLSALARDVRGNTLAIVALSLIPLAGMVGGGVDISRMYIVKTRLQHACDAGALAGRKSMGGGVWSYSNYAPRVAAEKFFEANIGTSPYGATSVTKEFTEAAGKVSGTASAVLPMTLMKIFGRTSETLTVVCDAEMRLPNTDVMFVLDTTGSMASKAVNTDPDTKIESLKLAVKCFYEIVARLDTNATCTNGNPSGGTGDQVQIRFGFMPYATNVNVGKLLPTSYFADNWFYQTRKANYTSTAGTPTWGNQIDSVGPSGTDAGVGSGWANYGSAQFGACPSAPSTPAVGPVTSTADTAITTSGNTRYWDTRTTSGTTYTEYQEVKTFFGLICQLQVQTRTSGTYTSVRHTQTLTTSAPTLTFQNWTYDRLSQPISGLKNGTSWNNSFTLPIGTSGAAKTITWDGCVEERATTKATSYTPITTATKDLQIDLVPDASDATTLWGPVLPDVIYTRQGTSSSDGNTDNWNRAAITNTNNYGNGSQYFCPTEARKLQAWPDATAFQTYVDGLVATGNTYHDIGMLWGARFVSPTGIFRSENEYTSKGGEIERHLIFMTDGDTVAQNYDYTAYGVPWFDRRQTNDNSVPSASDLNAQVNARFEALCTAVKNKNITLWVISFGSGSNSTTETRLENCATSGRYFVARDSATLQSTFRSIADQISQLRLTR